WLPQSPDLNHIEDFRQFLNQDFENKMQPRTIEDSRTEKMFIEEWKLISEEI
ncbi:12701_t:CDS:1, partial [Funneliformis mosseae]